MASFRKIQQRGQAAIEYMLLLTVVAVVVLLAIKTTGSPSLLNRAHTDTEGYYNSVTQVIMGNDPRPIDGGLCPPKPNGQRECACPQPAFGGAPCPTGSGSGGSVGPYCGDNICNGNETGEPGHPANASDPKLTCFNDCDFIDCLNCANLEISGDCGDPCGASTCSAMQVCMKSRCSATCPGFQAVCQDRPTLCSGSCSCNPSSWSPVGGCGVPVGACSPNIFQRCFQNSNCNAACTPSQTVQARSDPTCGQCPPTSYDIVCGSGTVVFPSTPNGGLASVACPPGCVARNMQADCIDGALVGFRNFCTSTDCPPTPVSHPDCGSTSLPSAPHGTLGQQPCPNSCDGGFSALCADGTYINIQNSCQPRPCGGSVATANCGSLTLPGQPTGPAQTYACPPGCSGTFTARCSNASFINVVDQCFRNCTAQAQPTALCGSVSLPATVHGNVSASVACPFGCTGTALATCSNGVFVGLTENCTPPPCPPQSVSTAFCGPTTIPGTTAGNVSNGTCPPGCSGSISAVCSAGSTFGPPTDNCRLDCAAQSLSTGVCGSVSIPATQDGFTQTSACPGGCTGTFSARCNNGSLSVVTNTCL